MHNVDARALTSLVAVCLALTMVCFIAVVGSRNHRHAVNAAPAMIAQRSDAPLINYGLEVETPAFNMSTRAAMEEAEPSGETNPAE